MSAQQAKAASDGQHTQGHNLYDVEAVRADFPALHQEVHGKPLVYLDNAATSQKPQVVIDTVREYYERDNSNVHRGVHTLSERATLAYEAARDTVQRFLNAADRREIVLVRGTTEAINLVAQSYGRPRLGAGDRILITHLEHHSNIVPWQLLAEQTGAEVDVVPILESGEIDLEAFHTLLGPRTRIVSVAHVSNALGTILPVREIVSASHAAGAVVMLDGAQAAPHMQVDVRELDVDFYALSSHKVFGPTGVGVLYGKAELLESMAPYQSGGDMIRTVSFEGTTWNDLPYKFEAGTPNIAGTIGLAAALDYVTELGLDAVAAHEQDLLDYATSLLEAMPGVRIVGTAPSKASVLSFLVDGIHAHDMGTIVDRQGVAIRTGHHCAMPVMKYFGVAATSRASFALYNTRQEADALAAAIGKAQEMFAR